LPGPPELEAVDFGILLQEPTTIERQEQATDVPTNSKQIQRVSARLTRGIITSKKFGDEDFDKRSGQTRIAKIAWKIDPNDEDEPATVKEAINHLTLGK
jgi:hypothetical protein